MSAESVYLILPTTQVGGTEKRLTGLFLHLLEKGEDIRLVASRDLVAQLAAATDCKDVVKHADRIDSFEAKEYSISELRSQLRVIFRQSPRGVFHYALGSPLRLHASRSNRTLFTIPNASLDQYNRRGLVEVYGGILRATRVDVLDPNVFGQLCSRFPWRRGSFSLTPGSYVQLDVYTPLPAAKKANAIVFAGLFSDEKQAPRLVACLPDLLARIDRELPDAQTEIWLMGRDHPFVPSVTEAVRAMQNPRIRAWHEANPKDVLARGKVFLSLQRSTNHPSKSLLEAMACGCVPVVTDTRDSRRSAPDHLATYVPRDFSADDLARATIPLLARPAAQIDAHAAAMRAFLSESFSIETMARYFSMLYAQLRALPVADGG